MKKNFCVILIALIFTILCSCSNTGKNSATDSSAQNREPTKEPIDTADTRLANDLSVFCTSQINAAGLAATKASTQKVKAFAKQNALLYKELGNHLNQVLETFNIKLPAGPSAKSKENFQDLEGIKGASFDHAYLLQMLKDHNIMIRENNASKNVKCFPIKLFVISNQAAIIRQAYALADLKDKMP